MNIPSPKIIESALSLIGEKGIFLADFKKFSGLRHGFGLGFDDHQRALDFLLQNHFVVQSADRLRLGTLSEELWLTEALKVGDDC